MQALGLLLHLLLQLLLHPLLQCMVEQSFSSQCPPTSSLLLLLHRCAPILTWSSRSMPLETPPMPFPLQAGPLVCPPLLLQALPQSSLTSLACCC